MSDIEFTGERFIPGQGGARIAYEHLHRYLFARRWARGLKVLDAAAGTGYGAALLSSCGARVWAVDLDGQTVRNARRCHTQENVFFIQADATCLPVPSGSVDLVTAFEVLEHVQDPEALVRELARVCRSGGLVLVSTPNKAVYSDARPYRNPFHVKEFYRDELLSLLGGHFQDVVLLHQQLRAGSLIDGDQGEHTEILTEPLPPGRPAAPGPMYFLALCGNGPSMAWLPRSSAYLDLTDALMIEWSNEVESGSREIARLNEKVRELGSWAGELDRELARRDQSIRALQQEMTAEIGNRDRIIGELQQQIEERGRWALSLRQDIEDRDERLRRTNAALDEAAAHLARIRHAFVYRVLCRLGVLPE